MTFWKHPAVLIAAGAIAGAAVGLIVGEPAGELKVFGDVFIRLVQMAIVPLVMASVVVGTGSLAGAGTGRLAARTVGWMLGFSLISALLAWVLAATLRPGAGIDLSGVADPGLDASAAEATTWQDTLLGFVSTNVFEAMSAGSMIPVIVFSVLFGLALNRYVATSGNRLVLELATQLQSVLLGMIRLVMLIAPIGVFCLLAALTGTVGASVVLSGLAYLGTTALGVAILTVLFVVVVSLRTGLNPLRLPAHLAEQTAVAVTTTSSAVTFPTVLRTAIERIGVSPRIANFTLSLGMTMGSYGAVLNYMIVVMFLAQSGDMQLGVGQIVLGMALAILLNMGTITVPGGFPVVAMFLATTMGLPLEAVGLLIAVDWFTGILRTFLNVNGDTVVAMLVSHAEGELDREVYAGARRASTEDAPSDASPSDALPSGALPSASDAPLSSPSAAAEPRPALATSTTSA